MLTWRTCLVVLAALICLGLILWSSQPFQSCMQEATKYYGGAALPKGIFYIVAILKSFKSCFGIYILEKNAVITALATIIIAWFTGTIWSINRSQLLHSRKIERAYVSGGTIIQFEVTGNRRVRGGGISANDPVVSEPITEPHRLVITVDNHGKTPAFIADIAAAVCSRDELNLTPEYTTSRRLADISLSPGAVAFATQVMFDFKGVGGKVVYGRIYYTDIFGDSHSSGFVRQILGTTTGPVTAPSAYTNWD